MTSFWLLLFTWLFMCGAVRSFISESIQSEFKVDLEKSFGHPINAVSCSAEHVLLISSINGVFQMDNKGQVVPLDVPKANWLSGQVSGDGKLLSVGAQAGAETHQNMLSGKRVIANPPCSSVYLVNMTNLSVRCPTHGPPPNLVIEGVSLDHTGQHQIVSASEGYQFFGLIPNGSGNVYVSWDFGDTWLPIMEHEDPFWAQVAMLRFGLKAYIGQWTRNRGQTLPSRIFEFDMKTRDYVVVFTSSIKAGVVNIASDSTADIAYFSEVSGVYKIVNSTAILLIPANYLSASDAPFIFASGPNFLLFESNRFSVYGNFGSRLYSATSVDFGKMGEIIGCVQQRADSSIEVVLVGNTYNSYDHTNDLTLGSSKVVHLILDNWGAGSVFVLAGVLAVCMTGLWIYAKYYQPYDVFISYRWASDALYAEHLFKILSSYPYNFRVFLDKCELTKGEYFQREFADAISRTKYFVCLVSKGAWFRFESHTDDANIDNVLLEQQHALEFLEQKRIRVYPVFIGEVQNVTPVPQIITSNSNQINDASQWCLQRYLCCRFRILRQPSLPSQTDSNPFQNTFLAFSCNPSDYANVVVNANRNYMIESRKLYGLPTVPTMSARTVVEKILKCNGGYISGNGQKAVMLIAKEIQEALQQLEVRDNKMRNAILGCVIAVLFLWIMFNGT